MPVIKSIRIKNFKGAADVTIDLHGKVSTPVITLIGLNESGKTTVLEGISYFVSADSAVSNIFEGVHSKSAINALVPIHKKAAFTDQVSIEAIVELNDTDLDAVCKTGFKNDAEIERSTFPTSISVSQTYDFNDSVNTEHDRVWDVTFYSKAKGRRQKRVENSNTSVAVKTQNLWDHVTDTINARLPRIAYFPTFLVDMPARIYLMEHKDEKPVNKYYRRVLQDVLDSLGENISLSKHVCKRIEDFKLSQDTPAWISLIFGGATKAPIDSVFQKISNAVTREVLGSWTAVFQRPVSAKLVSMEWNIDAQAGDLPYATFSVSDGESKYRVSERSLGFRWFFSFLLFTAFKKASSRPTLFLFDEPAANLHAKAQAELLKSFSRITADGNQIVYSTHSHHMINPRWLSGAYIIENTAVDYDSSDAFGLTTKPTNVVCTPYRQFVSQYPSRTSYFQPVIDQLEYVAPEVIGAPPFLMVEGISDYYALKSVQSTDRERTINLSILPGCGAGAAGPLISLLMGRGEKFFVLLDDDNAGRDSALRYREEWFLSQDVVQTLGELIPALKEKKLETLLSQETRDLIKTRTSKSALTKKDIGLFLAEAYATDLPIDNFMTPETQATLMEISARLSCCLHRELRL